MRAANDQPTADRIQVVAAQALRAIERQEGGILAFWHRRHNQLHQQIADLVDLVCQVDPAPFSEDQFVVLGDKLTRVIEAMERYFAKHATASNPAECQFLGSSVQRLKDARRWIAQGLSPDPARRPSEAERERMANDIAADAFNALRA